MENLCRYKLYTGCPKQKFTVRVLGTEATLLIKFSQSC